MHLVSDIVLQSKDNIVFETVINNYSQAYLAIINWKYLLTLKLFKKLMLTTHTISLLTNTKVLSIKISL